MLTRFWMMLDMRQLELTWPMLLETVATTDSAISVNRGRRIDVVSPQHPVVFLTVLATAGMHYAVVLSP